MTTIDWENDALCDVCTRGFTHREWENRHTEEATGGDVHDYCCELCGPNETKALLQRVGYETLEEWGLDSDYYQVGDQWYDENDNEVDLAGQLAGAVESLDCDLKVSEETIVVNDAYRNAVVGVVRLVANRSWGDDRRMVTIDTTSDWGLPSVRVRIPVENYQDAEVLVGYEVCVRGSRLYRIS